ncbi:putative receptor-like protein kinase At3g47110 isoform X2 [Salvia miltiorrhiza]|uniref:putative receptor-like protein kinase At3g47110 isoform X2 n=1 Tax=Salvia miltiorrhiza TaxID=226208 RepID=UPI0025ABEB11|nr:putative receptor-like protein kinase At3g47110 isoform X2 [Salvia miltiorrhiza]XP_057797615.1 putative receptor-like protein kinase At3g47110 isoform X2 [Salvia miltiorrhiza]
MDKTFAHLFAFAVFLLSYSSPKSFTTANLATDQSSLLSLKTHIISDTYLTNWSNSSSVCSWIGVTCSTRHRRVAALNISDMGLSGNIPPQLGNLSFLVSLDLASNNFSGTLPQELSRLRRLKIMSLSVNNFVGEIPSWLPLLPKLEFISLRGNSFTGSIPKSISNLTNLYHLDFSSNSLDGKIPQELGELQRLQHLVIQSNHLSGIIPSALFNMSSLRRLAFRSNELSGNLPNDLCANLPVIQEIYLGINQLSGQIPSNLSRCSQLGLLSLASNSFSGQIPAAVGDLKSIRILQLSRNHLSGTVPLNIFNISSLRSLYLSSNKLYGNLSRDIGNLTMLTDLFLSENNFTVPKSLQALTHLNNFNVSFNALSGEIPSGGPFMNFTMESFKGNEALCGIPRFDVPTCNVVNKHKSKKVEFALFILVGVVAFTTILCLGFIFIRFKMKDRAKSETIEILSVVPGRISYYELSQATQQFNESNLLGTGSFGSVYKGILGNGNGIAVKVFNLQSEAAFRSFDVECEVLRNIRHRNLTKVISTCSNEEFKALVLEYMPKGNLEKWLYSHNYILDFIQRLNIMIDVAMALEYLHHGYFTPIVHCDLKPSNVLLDEEMIAHVSDFGVSKLLGEGESVVLTKTLATLGYIAPEYGFEGLVSTKCDVYSYGVMLMEIFTRKKPSDDMFAGDLSLKIWIESSVLQSTYRVIDDNLLMNVDEEHGDKIVEFTSSILELALKCSTDSPKERINMKEALAEMLKIKRQFLE